MKLRKLQPCVSRPCQLTWGLVRLLCWYSRYSFVCVSLSVYFDSWYLSLQRACDSPSDACKQLSFSKASWIRAAIAPFPLSSKPAEANGCRYALIVLPGQPTQRLLITLHILYRTLCGAPSREG